MKHGARAHRVSFYSSKGIVLGGEALYHSVRYLMQYGTAPHKLLALAIKTGGDRHLAMLSVSFLQAFDAYQHLVVVADAYGLHDVALQVGAHGAVESRQPVGLIGKDACQR